jgi:hypothetical protein
VLTKTVIDRAAPRTAPFILWCDQLTGFGCKVLPSGKRVFLVTYRRRGSPRKYWDTIGTYGTLSIDAARKAAQQRLAAVQLGTDPRQADQAGAGTGLTVAGLVTEYIAALRDGSAATRRSQGRMPAPGYVSDTVLHLNRLVDRYGTVAANALTRTELLALLKPWAEQPAVYRRLHGAIRRLYVWARRHGQVTASPAEDIETRAVQRSIQLT